MLASLAMKATPEDVDRICRSLPQVELGISWGDRPTYKVPFGPKGKGFVFSRPPGPTAIDPATGERFTDILVISVSDELTKDALVQESRLGELEVDELEDILTDAWACKAPKKLVDEYFATRGELGD